jgi:hypothetical protein
MPAGDIEEPGNHAVRGGRTHVGCHRLRRGFEYRVPPSHLQVRVALSPPEVGLHGGLRAGKKIDVSRLQELQPIEKYRLRKIGKKQTACNPALQPYPNAAMVRL